MSNWQLAFTPEAHSDLDKLSKNIQRRVIAKLDWLTENFDNLEPLPLSSDWKGFFKLRVGEWRVIYKIDWVKELIIVWIIDKRDQIYKKRIK